MADAERQDLINMPSFKPRQADRMLRFPSCSLTKALPILQHVERLGSIVTIMSELPGGGPERRAALTREVAERTGIDETMIERLVRARSIAESMRQGLSPHQGRPI